MYANDVDVDRRKTSVIVIIIIPANDDDGSFGIDGLLLLSFILVLTRELSIIGKCIIISCVDFFNFGSTEFK